MMPLRNKYVQARVTDDELADFNRVKEQLGVENNSAVIRQMVADEMLIERMQQEWATGKTDNVMSWVNKMKDLRRPAMAQALLGITDPNSRVMLRRTMDVYQDMQDQLAGLMWSVANISNNLNQVAHVLNTAKSEDPADADTWNWVNNQLVTQQQLNNDLKQKLQLFKQKYLVTNNDGTRNPQLSA